MRKGKLSMLGAGFALALAGLTGSAQAVQPLTQTNTTQEETKSTPAKHSSRRQTIENTIGGIPLISHIPNYGMSPKEYGIRHGNGSSRKNKSNRLRYSHDAKLKRR